MITKEYQRLLSKIKALEDELYYYKKYIDLLIINATGGKYSTDGEIISEIEQKQKEGPKLKLIKQ